jgi:acetylornithine deacetylase
MPVRPAMCLIGEPTDMKVVIGHKGKSSNRVRVRGFEAHSSLAPQGVNAVAYAAELIVFLNRMAERFAKNGPFDEAYGVPYTTVHTGVVTGGTALNIVPKDCSFEFEIRHLPEDDPHALLHEIVDYARRELEPRMQAIRPETGFTFEERSTVPGLNIRDDEEVVRLAKALTGQNDHSKVAFGTEAGLFHLRAGIPTVVCGPGSIDQAHKPDEWIHREQVARCEAFVRRLIDHVCARP